MQGTQPAFSSQTGATEAAVPFVVRRPKFTKACDPPLFSGAHPEGKRVPGGLIREGMFFKPQGGYGAGITTRTHPKIVAPEGSFKRTGK